MPLHTIQTSFEVRSHQPQAVLDVEARIEGLVCEGFYVDWAEHESRLFLRVWEFGGPEPDWPSVFCGAITPSLGITY